MAEYKGTKNGGDDGRRKRPTQEDRRRTVGMIRDFFVHLLWELRLAASVLTSGRRAVHPELQEQVDRLRKAYPVGRLVLLPPMGEPSHVFALERCRCIEAARHLEALDAEFEAGLRGFRPVRAPRGDGYDADLISDFLMQLGQTLQDRKPDSPSSGKRSAANKRRRGTGADDRSPTPNGDAGQQPTPFQHLLALLTVLSHATQCAAAASSAATDGAPAFPVEATAAARAPTAIRILLAQLIRPDASDAECEKAAIATAETVLAHIDNCAGMSLRDFPFLTCRDDVEECSRIVLGRAGGGAESLTRDQVYHLLHCRLASIALKWTFRSVTSRIRALVDLTIALAMQGGLSQQDADIVREQVELGIERCAPPPAACDESDGDEATVAACEAMAAGIRHLLGPQGYLATGQEYLRDLLPGP